MVPRGQRYSDSVKQHRVKFLVYYYCVTVITITVVGCLTAQNASNWYVTKIDIGIQTYGLTMTSRFLLSRQELLSVT